MDCLRAELARLTDIVKGMDTRMTKGTDGRVSNGKERGRKEQSRDKTDEERSLRGGRVIARKPNGERTTENMACRKVTVRKREGQEVMR